MKPMALTRASELIHVATSLEGLGVSVERMLEQAKLPMWQHCDPDDLIPTRDIHVLMDRAARTFGSPTFGLQVGAQTSLSTMGSFGRLIASSLTPYHAMETSCRLIRFHNTGSHLSLVEAGDEVWFCHKEFPSPTAGRDQKEQYALIRMIDNVRMAAGPNWRPAKVSLQRQEEARHELREALGDPEIRIGQAATAIAIPRALLAQPVPRPDPIPARETEEIEARLWRTAPAGNFAGSLRQLAGTLLKVEGPPRIETMAEITGLSVRSLQRRLAQHRLNHSEIVDQARFQAATRLLADADIPIVDIAMDLGYADSAHFIRAFRRWAGMTPREYRNHQAIR